MQNIMGKTTISIDTDLCLALKRLGSMGDHYNDVIRQLVKNEQDRRQRKEKK
jgi:hypothetical protein